MLASLLPGLRELRTPLAAGYLWLVALWLAVAQSFPDRSDADGVAETVYELVDGVSVVGVGVAASFAAYIVGALSLAFFTTPLRMLFRSERLTQVEQLNPFSKQARAAVEQLAREARVRLEGLVALRETPLEQLIAEEARPLGRAPRRRPRRPATLTASTRVLSPAESREAALRRLILDDFKLVMTRLLGTETDLYSAIDRHRAEVEFRLGVIPPLAALACVVGVLVGWPWSGIAAAAGVVAVAGLFWDAVNRERDGNDLIADALAIRRVAAPTLERLETRATALATRSPSEAAATEVADACKTLGTAVTLAGDLDSTPSRLPTARDAWAEADARLRALDGALFPRTIEAGRVVLEAIRPRIDYFEDGADRSEQLAERDGFLASVKPLHDAARAAAAEESDALVNGR